MATRLATPRNFITVTPVSSTNNSSNATPMSTSSASTTTTDVQQSTQITPVTLHHVLQQVTYFSKNSKFTRIKKN